MSRLRALVQRSESNTREIARGGVINAGSAGLGAAASFGLLVVLTRGTSLDTTGLFFEALALASVISLVTSLGAPTSMTRTVAAIRRNQGEDATTAIWVGLLPLAASTTLVSVACAARSDTIAGILTTSQHRSELAALIVPTVLAVPFMTITRFSCAVARAVDDPVAGALYDFGGQPALRLAIALLLVLTQHVGGTALGLIVLLPAVSCFVGSLAQMRHSVRKAGITLSSRPRWANASAWSFWRFSLPRGLEEVVQASNIWLLTLLVGALASASQAGAYAALTRYTMATTLILQAVTTALLPRLAGAFHRGEMDAANKIFHRTTQWIIVASVPICLALLLFPSALLSLVSPELVSVKLGLQVLAIGSIVNVLTGPVGGVVLMAGRSTINLGAAVVAMVAMVVPALLLIPSHGATGASFAWAFSLTAQNLLLYLYCRVRLAMSPWSRRTNGQTARAAGAAALPMVLALLLLQDDLAGCLVGVSVSCLVVVLWFRARVVQREADG